MQSKSEASHQPTQDIREGWIRFKKKLEDNMPHLVEKMESVDIAALRRKFLSKMELEFNFCHMYEETDRYDEKRRVNDFCECLIYRPDICEEMEQYMRSEDVRLYDVADILEKALKVANWPIGTWSNPQEPPKTESSGIEWNRVLTQIGDAMAGVATIADADLKMQELISEKTRTKMKMLHPPFSAKRGTVILQDFRQKDQTKVREFFKEKRNNFILRVFDLALAGRWSCPQVQSTLPSLPNYYVERHEEMEKFNAIVEKRFNAIVENKFNASQQHWITVHGQGGAGKTVIATAMALRITDVSAKRPIWIKCGGKTKDDIWTTAQEEIADELDLSIGGDPQSFLQQNLTQENSKHLVLFLDDVRDPEVLNPFSKAQFAVLTCRWCIQYHRISEENRTSIDIPMSMGNKKSMELIEKIVNQKITSGREHLESILRTVKCNALATAIIGSHIKMTEELNERFFRELEEKFMAGISEKGERFKKMEENLKNRGHDYTEDDKKHTVNIYRTLDLVIREMRDDMKTAFYSLVVFPRDITITKKPFTKAGSDEEYLDFLVARSLLQSNGDDFDLHDLIRDVLEWHFENPPKANQPPDHKKIFQKLVKGYDEEEKIDADDRYLLLYFIGACVKAERVDVAQKFLQTPDYLLIRFFQHRFINFIRDFDDVLSVEGNAAVRAFRDLILDPFLWHDSTDRCSLLRQAVLLRREPNVDSIMLRQAQKETELPLFRAEPQEKIKQEESYEEFARESVTDKLQKIVLAPNGDVLAVSEAELLIFSKSLKILARRHLCDRQKIPEKILCITTLCNRRWGLLTESCFIIIDMELQEHFRWNLQEIMEISSENIKKAAISPDGSCAVLWWGKESDVIKIDLKSSKWEKIEIVPLVGAEVLALSMSDSFVMAILYNEENGEEGMFVMVWDIAEKEIVARIDYEWTEWSGIEHPNWSCALLTNSCLAFCNGHLLRLLDWRSEETIDKFNFSKVDCSNDGNTVALFSQENGLLLRDSFPLKNIHDTFDSRRINISNPVDYALSESALIISTEDNLLVYLHLNDHRVSYPRITCSKVRCLEAIWLPDKNDFVVFILEDNKLTAKAASATSGREMCCCSLDGWLDVQIEACEKMAVIWGWKSKRVRKLSMRETEWLPEEIDVEEELSVAAVSDSFITVGTESNAILLRRDSKWIRLGKVDDMIIQLFAFASAVGVWVWPTDFKLFDLEGNTKFTCDGVRDVQLSLCRKRAVLATGSSALEISEDGSEVRRFNDVMLYRMCLLPDGLLSWDLNGSVILHRKEKGSETMSNKFPKGVRQVVVLPNSNFVMLRTWNHQLWLYDVHNRNLELILNAQSSAVRKMVLDSPSVTSRELGFGPESLKVWDLFMGQQFSRNARLVLHPSLEIFFSIFLRKKYANVWSFVTKPEFESGLRPVLCWKDHKGNETITFPDLEFVEKNKIFLKEKEKAIFQTPEYENVQKALLQLIDTPRNEWKFIQMPLFIELQNFFMSSERAQLQEYLIMEKFFEISLLEMMFAMSEGSIRDGILKILFEFKMFSAAAKFFQKPHFGKAKPIRSVLSDTNGHRFLVHDGDDNFFFLDRI